MPLRYDPRQGRVPVLPHPDSLPFPGGLIRACTGCNLHSGCTAPVPGENIEWAIDIALVGQNPGVQEDLTGSPFVGKAGRYLVELLGQAGLWRRDVAICNLVKCRTPSNRAPSPAEISTCSRWLDLELEIVQPRVVVAMGRPAIAYFLGNDAGTVEQLHGRPVKLESYIVLPTYHPAAALHDTSKLRQCQEDFHVLRDLVLGMDWSRHLAVDEFPDVDYRVADTPQVRALLKRETEETGEFSVDTETCRSKLWSFQVSTRPGTAWFVPLRDDFKGRIDLTGWNATAIVHHYLFDIQWLKLRDDGFVDTMVMAYLTGQPQGLKELASRLCGLKMVNYSEIVRPGQHTLSQGYLDKILEREWPDPPIIVETRWSNKSGKIITYPKRPWHISRKVNKMLGDLETGHDVDLRDRWRGIPAEERDIVESVLGSMPEASLMDIPFEQAVEYGCRDADATIRVYLKLRQMIEKLDLDFVLYMDLRILPMVHNMMENGMAVDVDHYKALSKSYEKRLRARASELAGMIGHSFNPASGPQVASVVYEELGFTPTRFTSTSLVSTDDAELKKVDHPVADGVIRYRELQKLKSTYADNLIRSALPDADGVPRVHTVLKTTRVETGRLSSSKNEDGTGANLQNIPTRSSEAKAIKNGFIAPDGRLMVEGDYAQIEMCTQAHLAKCAGLIELFSRGGDPHTETAARLFDVSLEEAAKDKYRYPCKRAGFGIIYMIGSQGLSTQINEYIADLTRAGETVDLEPWSEDACAKFIEDYYQLYPEIRDYQKRQFEHAKRLGYVSDLFGRIRYIPEVVCPVPSVRESGARMAANMPVTATAQGIIKLAMIELWEQLPDTDWFDKVRWLMQIHDSLVVEVLDDETVYRPCLSWMGDIMRRVVSLRVPIRVDFKMGKRWGELAKYEARQREV